MTTKTNLEDEVRKVIKERIKEIAEKHNLQVFLLDNFGLDIAIFLSGSKQRKLQFLELKVYTRSRYNHIGITKIQFKLINILTKMKFNLPKDIGINWLFIDPSEKNSGLSKEDIQQGKYKFVILNSKQAADFIDPKDKDNKNFNFREIENLFENHGKSAEHLYEELEKFLLED